MSGHKYIGGRAVRCLRCDVPGERILRPLAGLQIGQRLRWLGEQLARSAA